MKNIFTGVLLLALLFFGLMVQLRAQTVVATADPDYVCYDSSSQLNAASGGITGVLSYSWTPTTGLDDPAIINPTASNLIETIIYTVEVTGNEGTFSDTTKVTVYEELIASIAANQTICYNTPPAQLTSTVTGGDESYTYQWQESPDETTWTDVPGATSDSYQPPTLTETTYYQLTVDDETCTAVTTNSVTITVYEELVASIAADQTICYNTVPDLLTSTVSGGDETYTYQWQDSLDGTTWTDISGATSSTYQPPALTNTNHYQLIVDDETCTPVTTNSIIVTVYDELLASIGSDQTISYNTVPNLLTSMVSGGDETYTYQWQNSPDEITWTDIPGGTSNTYQPDALTNTTYYQLIVDDETCTPVTSNSVTITVYGELIASISSDQTICYNTAPDLLTSSVSGGNETYNYQWQNSPDGTTWTDIPAATSASYQPPAITATTYYRLIVDDESSTPVTTNSVTITVYEELGASISSDQTICSNTIPNILSSIVSGGDESYTYQWQLYDGTNWFDIPGETNPTYQPGTLATTSDFQLIINDGANCGPFISNSVTITVIPNVTASISISASNNPTCNNEEVTFLISDTLNGGNDPGFEWYLNGTSKSSDNSWTSLVNDNDEVYAQMTSNAECLNDNPVNSDLITMTVNASPVLLNSGDLVPKPLDNPVVLICVDSVEANTYSWYEDGVEITGANEQFYYPTKYGQSFNFNSEYYVMIENEFCFSNSNLYIYAFNKSALFEESEVFIVYPTPNNGIFSLVLNEDVVPEDIESFNIRILDVTGKVVFKDEIFRMEQNIELSNIQTGLYFLDVIISESQHQVRKFIIEQ